jgi:hypothetical protein
MCWPMSVRVGNVKITTPAAGAVTFFPHVRSGINAAHLGNLEEFGSVVLSIMQIDNILR